METTVRVVESPEQRAALAALPRVGAAQAGAGGDTADADEVALAVAVYEGEQPVVALRLTPMDRLPDDSDWHAHYGSGRFPLPLTALWLLSDLRSDPERTTGAHAQALLETALDQARQRGAEVLLFGCPPALVGYAEILGWRRLGPGMALGEGFRLPMALIAGDWAHLETVRSPLLAAARRHPPNFTLPDWFDRHFPDYSRPANVRAQREDVFMAGLVARWRSGSAPLFDDLSAEERKRLLAAARTVEAGPGQALLRQGETDRDLFLILEGAVEVSETRRGRHQVLTTLGAGQIFGEGGFLVNTPRSADLTAIAPSRLLVFSPEAFDRLAKKHPSLALKLMRNLSRALCLRVYAGAGN